MSNPQFIIVVGKDRRAFENWCRDHNENPRDRKFVHYKAPKDIWGLQQNEDGTRIKLVLLYEWWRIIDDEMIWDEEEREYEFVPNEMMQGLIALFRKPWGQIHENAEVVYRDPLEDR